MSKGKKDELDDAEQLDEKPQPKKKGPLLKWILIISLYLMTSGGDIMPLLLVRNNHAK